MFSESILPRPVGTPASIIQSLIKW